jgi:phosphoglycolate phosphatase
MKPKLIIFDFDGTLCDTRKNIIIAFRATMERLGLPMRSEEECAATIGLTLYDGFRSLYPNFSDNEAEHAVETYRAIFAEQRKELMPDLFPKVGETLDTLYNNGYTLSIASSRLTDSLMLFMQAHHIDHYFSYVVGSDSVTHHKPHAEPVLVTLQELGVDASEAIVVGDMTVDILMARNAGVVNVGITWGNASREELQQAEADYIIDHIETLLTLLER